MIESDWPDCFDLHLMLDSLKGMISSRKAVLFACACCRRIWDLLIDERSRIAVERRELHADQLITTEELERVWDAANNARSVLATRFEEQGNALNQSIRTALGLESKVDSASQDKTNQTSQSAWLDWAFLLAILEPQERLPWLRDLETKFEADNGLRQVLSRLEELRIKLESKEEASLANAVQAYHKAKSCSFAAVAASRLAWIVETEQEVVGLTKTVAKYASEATSSLSDSFHGKREREAQCSLLRDIVGNPFRPSTINRSQVEWNEGEVYRTAQTIYENGHFDEASRLGDSLQMAGCDNEDILNHCRSKEHHVRGCWVIDLILGKQ